MGRLSGLYDAKQLGTLALCCADVYLSDHRNTNGNGDGSRLEHIYLHHLARDLWICWRFLDSFVRQ